MTPSPDAGRPADEDGRCGRVAVVDVGSNSVRLVVFERLGLSLEPLFNEKVQCGLGRGFDASGRLNPTGVDRAVACLARFGRVAKAMEVSRLDALATAAVRDALDGEAFLRRVRAEAGLDLTILSGEDEARLAGYGVVAGIPDADGLVGDLGGGSLELVEVRAGDVRPRATLPLGHLRLRDLGLRRSGVADLIASHFSDLDWLPRHRGKPLYLVGGAWRALARQHLDQVRYPLHVIHRYTLKPDVAREFALSLAKSEKGGGNGGRRADAMPYASAVLASLIAAGDPSSIVFSAYGMREGHLFSLLPPEQRNEDPLIAACRDLMMRLGRFGAPEALFPWTDGLFSGETQAARRLRHAACLLSDLGWVEHPDYRAQHAFYRVLRLPIAGVDHVERAFLALTVYLRYAGGMKDQFASMATGLLTEGQTIKATVLGAALRLAHGLMGGAVEGLAETRLKVTGEKVLLTVPEGDLPLVGEVPLRRLAALASLVGKPPEVGPRRPPPVYWPHTVID